METPKLTVTGKPEGFLNWPHCDKCNKPVEQIEVQTPVRELRYEWFNLNGLEHTGEIIIAIRCHGETWRMSNYRGRLSS